MYTQDGGPGAYGYIITDSKTCKYTRLQLYLIAAIQHGVLPSTVQDAAAQLLQVRAAVLDPSQSGEARADHIQKLLHIHCTQTNPMNEPGQDFQLYSHRLYAYAEKILKGAMQEINGSLAAGSRNWHRFIVIGVLIQLCLLTFN